MFCSHLTICSKIDDLENECDDERVLIIFPFSFLSFFLVIWLFLFLLLVSPFLCGCVLVVFKTFLLFFCFNRILCGVA